ncbi:hypothetical protein [Thermospira aquatica]|uniref:Uncharacterized protein n=1 Tax=Thermospira aquatica TaxID=2828656 RepID=A0AAX3BGH3_9SPIR|nr:hypothetical protein [Thermospira aquatica]URA10546.1 hypothetical protein KDW03_01720 [Thermospira aquatica]
MRKSNIAEVKEEQKRFNEDLTQLKISFEKHYEKLIAIEKYLLQAIEHQNQIHLACKNTTEQRLQKIEKSIEEHGQRMGKLEQSIAKFIGAATLAGALTGIITSILSKLILK